VEGDIERELDGESNIEIDVEMDGETDVELLRESEWELEGEPEVDCCGVVHIIQHNREPVVTSATPISVWGSGATEPGPTT